MSHRTPPSPRTAPTHQAMLPPPVVGAQPMSQAAGSPQLAMGGLPTGQGPLQTAAVVAAARVAPCLPPLEATTHGWRGQQGSSAAPGGMPPEGQLEPWL